MLSPSPILPPRRYSVVLCGDSAGPVKRGLGPGNDLSLTFEGCRFLSLTQPAEAAGEGCKAVRKAVMSISLESSPDLTSLLREKQSDQEGSRGEL